MHAKWGKERECSSAFRTDSRIPSAFEFQTRRTYLQMTRTAASQLSIYYYCYISHLGVCECVCVCNMRRIRGMHEAGNFIIVIVGVHPDRRNVCNGTFFRPQNILCVTFCLIKCSECSVATVNVCCTQSQQTTTIWYLFSLHFHLLHSQSFARSL